MSTKKHHPQHKVEVPLVPFTAYKQHLTLTMDALVPPPKVIVRGIIRMKHIIALPYCTIRTLYSH